ncbi:hypothetical protein KL921_004764 [Ogataea angusta]|nr:hypothetical protein KL921_004764 [Ogataea angusta]KAG7832623.1 hypothetical protein KL943_004960 [Ogataea angusta]KAG7842715.1 hypothetical protein KL941_005091 [Ogataea angusta]KAG7853853.1 hypothetical protein KL939_005348 [Ogataea angusta]
MGINKQLSSRPLRYPFAFYRNGSHQPKLERTKENLSQTTSQLYKFNSFRDEYQIPKYPIVLCHGFSGFDSLVSLPAVELFHKAKSKEASAREMAQEADTKIEFFEYWHGIRKELRARGCQVLVAKVPPFATIETRSKILNEFIKHKIATRFPSATQPVKVNLIAHSMGGLDCRYLISAYEQENFEIVSLTTVSTPHRGSYAADRMLQLIPTGLVDSFLPSLKELTLESCARLNIHITDDPNVKYFSYGATFTPGIFNVFYPTWKMVYPKEGPNDGLVSIKSAKWGEFLGSLENVDHLDLINWMNISKRLKIVIGAGTFNPVALYLDIVDNLAKKGL